MDERVAPGRTSCGPLLAVSREAVRSEGRCVLADPDQLQTVDSQCKHGQLVINTPETEKTIVRRRRYLLHT